MINLLPREEKRQIVAGQTNRLLVRYCIISVALAVLLFVYIGISYFILMNSKSEAERTISEGNQKLNEHREVQQRAKQFSETLTSSSVESIIMPSGPISRTSASLSSVGCWSNNGPSNS